MPLLIRVVVVLMALAAPALAAPPELHRGVGLHEWLNWSPLNDDGSYRWPPYRTVEEWQSRYRPASDWPSGDPFVALHALGFDFVRLTVDPGPLYATEGSERQEALAVLEAATRRLLDADLKVVFNLHSVTQVAEHGRDVINAPANSAEIARYIAMTADVAKMLLPLGTDRVIFEPYNEPAHYPCDAGRTGDWQKIMTQSVKAIRAVSTELTLIATGACGGGVTGLVDLVPDFDDPNILYSFHMYEPHLFTHQFSEIEDGFASGLPWPASLGTPDAVIAMLETQMDVAGLDEAAKTENLKAVAPHVAQYFADGWSEAMMVDRVGAAVTWAKQHTIPVERLFMGEFGVILMSPDGRMGAFEPDRSRYITALRSEAEKQGIPWSLWEYSNPYGMTVIKPTGPVVPDEKLLEALGL
jgi:hypothetical protein